jgi:potassium/chloride transporter 9
MSRRRPNFSTRTAEEDVARLDPGDSVPTNLFRGIAQWWDKRDHNTEAQGSSRERVFPAGPLHESSTHKDHKHGHRFRSTDEPKKLGTLSGVFVPTTLNVLSILMFLRFGFILGQAGVLGILGMQIG